MTQKGIFDENLCRILSDESTYTCFIPRHVWCVGSLLSRS